MAKTGEVKCGMICWLKVRYQKWSRNHWWLDRKRTRPMLLNPLTKVEIRMLMAILIKLRKFMMNPQSRPEGHHQKEEHDYGNGNPTSPRDWLITLSFMQTLSYPSTAPNWVTHHLNSMSISCKSFEIRFTEKCQLRKKTELGQICFGWIIPRGENRP